MNEYGINLDNKAVEELKEAIGGGGQGGLSGGYSHSMLDVQAIAIGHHIDVEKAIALYDAKAQSFDYDNLDTVLDTASNYTFGYGFDSQGILTFGYNACKGGAFISIGSSNLAEVTYEPGYTLRQLLLANKEEIERQPIDDYAFPYSGGVQSQLDMYPFYLGNIYGHIGENAAFISGDELVSIFK